MRVLVLGGFVSGAIAAERNVDGLFFAITKDGELNISRQACILRLE